jgi:hypothetical protein
MADDGQWIIHEVTDVIATATEFGYRRATGEQIPWLEQVQLQRRKVLVLRAIAERIPQSADVHAVLRHAEHRLRHIGTPGPKPCTTQHRPDLGATS